MRKLLIPTDFSQNAQNAIKYGLKLFDPEPCKIFILHVYANEVYDNTFSFSNDDFEVLQMEVEQKVKKKLAGTIHTINTYLPSHKHEIKSLAKFGPLVDEANDVVETENIDLIIMGTRGKSADKKLTFGSQTLQVVKYVKCPVLSVPRGYQYLRPQNFLFPTDFLLPYKQREIELLGTLARKNEARIHIVYISKLKNLAVRQKHNKESLEEFLNYDNAFFRIEKGDDITSAINTYIAQNRIDFLILTNSRHSYLENILYTSTVEKIGLEIKIPFLVLQNLQRS